MHPYSVLITGANRGIGLEFVKQFLNLPEPPTHIFAACRSPEKAEDLKELSKKAPGLKIVKFDVGDLNAITTLKEEVERVVGNNGLNLLINNAGIMPTESLSDASADVMRETYDVNVVGPLMVSKAFTPLLKKAAQAKGGSGMSCNKAAIVTISSTLGSISFQRSGGQYAYKCSKAAVNMMTKVLSIDLKSDNILVTCFCPGWVLTDLGGKNAPMTTEKSVGDMLQVMSQMDEKDTGTFRSHSSKTVNW